MRQPVIWITLAVMAVAAGLAAATVKDTRDRIVRIEREACRTEASCKLLLNRLLRFSSDRQKRAIIQSLPNVRERLRRQIAPEGRPAPKPVPIPRTTTPMPTPPAAPVKPQPGPPGPPGPPGRDGKDAPKPVAPVDPPVTVPDVPEPTEPLPPLPEPACEVLPALCPDPDQVE